MKTFRPALVSLSACLATCAIRLARQGVALVILEPQGASR
jgi:hypothetical protein